MKNKIYLVLAITTIILVSCGQAMTTKTYSVEEMKDDDALFERIGKQCEMGEIPLDSANCANFEKAALLRFW